LWYNAAAFASEYKSDGNAELTPVLWN